MITVTTAIEKVNGHAVDREPRVDHKALAEADAIRRQAEADAEQQRIAAEAQAEAVRIKAREDAEKQRLSNERSAMRLQREKAENDAKVAEANRRRDEADRAREAARKEAVAAAAAEVEQAADIAQADKRWRTYALAFYIVCAVVALPVQMAAFWSPSAPWLLVAPLMLEGGAWVVLKGAAAAVTNRRPHWHYRLIAWCLAGIAAGVNLWHGMAAFDPATAIGTAFASLAGPGVWDLHEHGRIRTRDGKLTRAERKAQRAQQKRDAAERRAAEQKKAAEQQQREEAAKDAAEKLATEREQHFPEVWKHALKMAAALGETTVTEAVWRRAWKDIEGGEPGDSVDILRNRNAAARRIAAARSGVPGEKPVKVTSPQAASQMATSGKKRVYNPPTRRGVRRKGDTPKYVPAASRQASITAKQAAQSGK